MATSGSFPWTYQLGREGHRLLQRAHVLPRDARFETREVYDYRYVLHEIHLNSWVLAWRGLVGRRLLRWDGETSIEPPREARSLQLRLDERISVEGLADPRARLVRPDSVLEIARGNGEGTRTLLVEYDRTHRVDKNFKKFRRYDALLCWWWRHCSLAHPTTTAWVIFICQDEEHMAAFLDSADRELTGHHWSPSGGPAYHQYVGRERIVFVKEGEIYDESTAGLRVPAFPRGHSARSDDGARLLGLPRVAAETPLA